MPPERERAYWQVLAQVLFDVQQRASPFLRLKWISWWRPSTWQSASFALSDILGLARVFWRLASSAARGWEGFDEERFWAGYAPDDSMLSVTDLQPYKREFDACIDTLQPQVCRVHGRDMLLGTARVQHDSRLYMRSYEESVAYDTLFPNAGSSWVSSFPDQDMPARPVRFFPECREAEKAWIAENE